MTAVAARTTSAPRPAAVLPGFRLTLAATLGYLTVLVALPVAALVVRATGLTVAEFWRIVSAPRAVAAYRLSLITALAAAAISVLAGSVVAWALVRRRFRGRRLLGALVDLPLALPTAVAGIALTTLWSRRGWLGGALAPFGIDVAFTRLGIVTALVFLGLPLVVRTVQPVLEDLDLDVELAATTLGATRWQTVWRILLPALRPALLTGFALAFARGIGEYGSVVFIAGNMPFRTEIVPLLIMARLEQFDMAGAAAVAVVLLAVSVALLLTIGIWQRPVRPRGRWSVAP